MSRAFLLIAVLLIVAGCGSAKQKAIDPSAAKASPELPFAFGSDILEDYDGNEVAADAKYNDKHMQICLWPKVIAKDSKGRYFAGTFFFADRTEGKPNLICYFSKENATPLASLKPSKATFDPDAQAVLITGTCKGRKRQTGAQPGFQVSFDQCQVVKLLTKPEVKELQSKHKK